MFKERMSQLGNGLKNNFKNNYGKYIAGAGLGALGVSEMIDPVLTSNGGNLAKNLWNIQTSDVLDDDTRENFRNIAGKQAWEGIKGWDSFDPENTKANINMHDNGVSITAGDKFPNVSFGKEAMPEFQTANNAPITNAQFLFNKMSGNLDTSPNVTEPIAASKSGPVIDDAYWDKATADSARNQEELAASKKAHEVFMAEREEAFARDRTEIAEDRQKTAAALQRAQPEEPKPEEPKPEEPKPEEPKPKNSTEVTDDIEKSLISGMEPSIDTNLPKFKSNISLPQPDLANGESSLKSRLLPSIDKLGKHSPKEIGDLIKTNNRQLSDAVNPEYYKAENGEVSYAPFSYRSPEIQAKILAQRH